MATCFSFLACKIPWTEEPDGVESTVLQRLDMTEQAQSLDQLHSSLYWALIERELCSDLSLAKFIKLWVCEGRATEVIWGNSYLVFSNRLSV